MAGVTVCCKEKSRSNNSARQSSYLRFNRITVTGPYSQPLVKSILSFFSRLFEINKKKKKNENKIEINTNSEWLKQGFSQSEVVLL